MTTQEIRTAYLKFFADRGHTVIPRANLVPQEDATTLFTGSGMQPLLPYLLGAPHPAGTKLADSQPAFRAEDIDEVGDNRHTTSFEMLGNWSLGSYFKAEQIPWMFEFLTSVVGLDPKKLYVTCFIGDPRSDIPKDTEAANLWKKEFDRAKIEANFADIGSEKDGYTRGIKPGERIFFYDGSKNWWNRGKTGPDTTPVGDPCGPDSEMFYDFGTPHDPKWGKHCHPNCDCGRFLEIGNNVFMSYKKVTSDTFQPLAARNIDQGSGLERIAAAAQNDPDVFKISLLWPIITRLQDLTHKSYDDHTGPMRIIADHLRAATFLAVDGVVPSNNQQGYVMRRLIRRAIRQAHALGLKDDLLNQLIPVIIDLYKDDLPEFEEREGAVIEALAREERQFRSTLERGLKVLTTKVFDIDTPDREGRHRRETIHRLSGEHIFTMFDTYGFPPELTIEEAKSRSIDIDAQWQDSFDKQMAAQKERSRTASVGQFKGGLADHSEISVKYHTATHLLYKALRIVLGDHVIQRGSNITPERLRFDFSHGEKMTRDQLERIEAIVNENIARDWPMGYREIPTDQAFAEGALGAFGDKYGETVKVYTAGDPDGEWYSKEICGGPHVTHTAALSEGDKHFKIIKEESSSAGIRRIKAKLI